MEKLMIFRHALSCPCSLGPCSCMNYTARSRLDLNSGLWTPAERGASGYTHGIW